MECMRGAAQVLRVAGQRAVDIARRERVPYVWRCRDCHLVRIGRFAAGLLCEEGSSVEVAGDADVPAFRISAPDLEMLALCGDLLRAFLRQCTQSASRGG